MGVATRATVLTTPPPTVARAPPPAAARRPAAPRPPPSARPPSTHPVLGPGAPAVARRSMLRARSVVVCVCGGRPPTATHGAGSGGGLLSTGALRAPHKFTNRSRPPTTLSTSSVSPRPGRPPPPAAAWGARWSPVSRGMRARAAPARAPFSHASARTLNRPTPHGRSLPPTPTAGRERAAAARRGRGRGSNLHPGCVFLPCPSGRPATPTPRTRHGATRAC